MSAVSDLFARSLIDTYVTDDRDFVERPSVDAAVRGAVADPNCRFLLITGSPGTGKTALMAWQATANPGSLRYFIRRDSRVPMASADPRSFLLAVGHQLATVRPALFRPDKLELVITQRAKKVLPGARVTAVKVQDLQVSPFYRSRRRTATSTT